jgi:hypothetical protein
VVPFAQPPAAQAARAGASAKAALIPPAIRLLIGR